MEFKLAIGDPKTKKTYKAVLSGGDSEKLVGKKIGDKFRGEILNLAGYELEITGGSDSAGFPMRRDVQGPARKKLVLSRGIGFKAKRKGMRRRKSVRGNTISDDISQINCKVVKAGKDSIAKAFGLEAPKTEDKKEEKVEEIKVEKPKEEVKEEKTEPEEEKTAEPKEELKKDEKSKKEELKVEEVKEETPKEGK